MDVLYRHKVTPESIMALVSEVALDGGIMDDDYTRYELKMGMGQGKWRDPKNRDQEATFTIVGEISPDARLGLYGDRLDQYLNVRLCNHVKVIVVKF